MTQHTSAAVPHVILGAPPRQVSRELRVRMWLSAPTQAACAFLAFGSVFFWAFVMQADLSGPLFWADVRTVNGVVDGIEELNASINKRKVTRYHYTFEIDGRRYEGESYAHKGPAVGAGAVPIEVSSTPSVSRIRGMRRDVFPGPVVLIALLPGLGLVVLVRTLASARMWLRLLVEGESGTAHLVSKERQESGGSKKNAQWKLLFAFEDERGQTREHVVMTYEPQRLTDESEEPVLYERGGGAVALLDEMPGHPRVREDGSIRIPSGVPLRALYILPAALVLLQVLGALAVLG